MAGCGGCGDGCGCGDAAHDAMECGLDPSLVQMLQDAGLDPVQVEDIAHLAIAEDQAGGRLGLASFAEGACGCCEPWTADELAAILRDLSTVASLQSQEPLAG